MKKILLARHSSQKKINDLLPKYWPLSEIGVKKCGVLAQYAEIYSPNIVYSTNGTKAKETGSLLAHHLKIPFKVYNKFPEHDRRNALLTKEQDEIQVAKHFYEPDKLFFGEFTANQEYNCFYAGIKKLIDDKKQETLAIVAHGTAITLLITRNCKLDPMSFWLHLGTPSLIVASWPQIELLEIIQNIDNYPRKINI